MGPSEIEGYPQTCAQTCWLLLGEITWWAFRPPKQRFAPCPADTLPDPAAPPSPPPWTSLPDKPPPSFCFNRSCPPSPSALNSSSSPSPTTQNKRITKHPKRSPRLLQNISGQLLMRFVSFKRLFLSLLIFCAASIFLDPWGFLLRLLLLLTVAKCSSSCCCAYRALAVALAFKQNISYML